MADMEALLLANIPVGEDAMRECGLAARRGGERLKPAANAPNWSPRAELTLEN